MTKMAFSKVKTHPNRIATRSATVLFDALSETSDLYPSLNAGTTSIRPDMLLHKLKNSIGVFWGRCPRPADSPAVFWTTKKPRRVPCFFVVQNTAGFGAAPQDISHWRRPLVFLAQPVAQCLFR